MERTLKVERREGTGKGVARKVRAAGGVPGVLYGRGAEPVLISVDARELLHTLHTDAGMNVLVDLMIGKEKVLAKLPEKQKACLLMREMQELSYEEISEALQLSLGSVKSNIHRAKVFLKEQLEKTGMTPEDV